MFFFPRDNKDNVAATRQARTDPFYVSVGDQGPGPSGGAGHAQEAEDDDSPGAGRGPLGEAGSDAAGRRVVQVDEGQLGIHGERDARRPEDRRDGHGDGRRFEGGSRRTPLARYHATRAVNVYH